MSVTPETLFRALSDETRLRCVALLTEGELCVCELTYALGLAQPKISRHLATLREAGVVRDRRAGLWVYYQINPALPGWAKTTLDSLATGVRDQSPYADDRASLADMPNRPGASRCA